MREEKQFTFEEKAVDSPPATDAEATVKEKARADITLVGEAKAVDPSH
jgi:hypothetical protein